MLKKDFEAFKENYECVSLEKGVYNIWLKHKSNKYGFKFFFKKWKGPLRFLKECEVNQMGIEEPYIVPNDKKGNRDLISFEDLNIMFSFLSKLDEKKLHPKPLKIIHFKSCYAIKIKYTKPLTEEMYAQRYHLLPHIHLKEFLSLNTIKFILANYQIDNYGIYKNNLMLLDIDAHILKEYKQKL